MEGFPLDNEEAIQQHLLREQEAETSAALRR